MKPILTLHQGHPAVRDPRKMTQDELKEACHEPMSPLQALRARCLDCCGYQEKEVASCTAVDCPSWPFRMGTDPWRKPASEARREAARQAMTKLNSRRRKRKSAEPPASPTDGGIAPLLAEDSKAASTSTTARVDHAHETEPHRVGASGSGQTSDRFREGPISGEAWDHRSR
jgi:hypothetical protein